MDKQRILKEAQKIASKFSFWMVSGNIAHLFGYPYETPEKKYELEIKFDEDFPNVPPQLIYHEEIKQLLGDFTLNTIRNWSAEDSVVDIIHELKAKIQEALMEPMIVEEKQLVPIIEISDAVQPKTETSPPSTSSSSETEEYITPDFNAYPDEEYQQYITPSSEKYFFDETSSMPSPQTSPQSSDTAQEDYIGGSEPASIVVNTELGLIQQEYAYDQRGPKKGEINVYITITLTKTFIVPIDFTNYPERPIITFPDEIKDLLGDPYKTLEILSKWKSKKAPHIIDVLHELENKLYFIKDIEIEAKKIFGEYQCDMVSNSVTNLRVHIVTYGFKEYLLYVDLGKYPKPPSIGYTPELEQLVNIPITELDAYKNWRERESEAVELIREIHWLVDKNSRINFELELLKADYKEMDYNHSSRTIHINMKGKMKTQDLTFEFEVVLPKEYPTIVPAIKVVNEFDLEHQEKVRKDLETSLQGFTNEWTPFKYLVDLFKEISKKIFEVSVMSCVICHKIECPTCSVRIAGDNACHVECPYCERPYHKHCWDMTIKSFGKCGFCLKTPPPSMMY